MVADYRSKDWANFRAEVLRLDGYACSVCGRPAGGDTVLQVHHKRYIAGRRPWEYPHAMCTTICRGCHAVEHGKIPPTFGWEHVGYEDLGDLCGSCDYCGTAIRHSFLVQHPRWLAMEVGEICCDHLTATTVATDHIKARQKYSLRLKNFIGSKRWTVATYYDEHSMTRKKQRFLIKPTKTEGYRVYVDGKGGRLRFASVLEAKIKLFEIIDGGQLAAFNKQQDAKRDALSLLRR